MTEICCHVIQYFYMIAADVQISSSTKPNQRAAQEIGTDGNTGLFFIFQNYFFHTVTFRTPPRISCHTDLYYLIFFFFTQNTGLNTENFRLKKNISALLKTARQEVIRKDAEIQRLNQM